MNVNISRKYHKYLIFEGQNSLICYYENSIIQADKYDKFEPM